MYFRQPLLFPLASSIRSDREDSAGKIVRAPQVGMSEFRFNNFQFKRDTTKTLNHCRGRPLLRLHQRKCTFGNLSFSRLPARSDREDSAGKLVRAPQVGMSEFRSNNF